MENNKKCEFQECENTNTMPTFLDVTSDTQFYLCHDGGIETSHYEDNMAGSVGICFDPDCNTLIDIWDYEFCRQCVYTSPIELGLTPVNCKIYSCDKEIYKPNKTLCGWHEYDEDFIKTCIDDNCDNLIEQYDYDKCDKCHFLSIQDDIKPQIRHDVYILQTEFKGEFDFYIGISANLQARLTEHRMNKVSATKHKKRRLVFFTNVRNESMAKALENKLWKIKKQNPRFIIKMTENFKSFAKNIDREF